MSLLDGITDSMDISLSKLQEIVKDREAQCVAVYRVGHNLVTENNISFQKLLGMWKIAK